MPVWITRLWRRSIKSSYWYVDLIASLGQKITSILVIIALIGTHMLWLVRTWHDDRIYEIYNLRIVMAIRWTYGYRQGNAGTIRQNVLLSSWFPAVCGVITDFFVDYPFLTIPGAFPRAASIDCQSHSMPLRSSYSSQSMVQSLAKIPSLTHVLNLK